MTGLIFLLGIAKLPNVGATRAIPHDLLSVGLSAVGFGGLVYGLSSMSAMLAGEGTTEILITAAGVLALISFVLRQNALAKDERALMDLRAFSYRNYTLSIILMLLAFALFLGLVTVLPIYPQTSLGGHGRGRWPGGHAGRSDSGPHLPVHRPDL